MEWVVKNALSRDVERQHLNKILKEIRAAIDEYSSGSSFDNVEDIVGSMVEGNRESGISVTYNPVNKVLDFAVAAFTIRLAGDVTGTATVSSLGTMVLNTTIDPAARGVEEAPQDGTPYWRQDGSWYNVPNAIFRLAEVDDPGLLTMDTYGNIYGTAIEGTEDEIVVEDGDGVEGPPVISLSDLENTGEGVSPVKIYTRDSKGRIVGDEDASTDDLPEGSNLYFTDARADARISAAKADPDGIASLSGGKLDAGQLPALAITETFVVSTEAAMLALDVQQGDVAVRSDLQASFILTAEPASTLPNWQELLAPTGVGVASFNGRTGSVVPATGDYTAAQVGADPAGTAAAIVTQTIANGDTSHAPSGDAVADALAGKLSADGSVVATGNLLNSTSDFRVGPNTADGSDTSRTAIMGGGLTNQGRGGYVVVFGNEHPVQPGNVQISAGIAGDVYLLGGAIRPQNDGAIPLGIGAARYSEVFAVNGAINTSDAREKTEPRDLTEAEIAAAADIARLPCIFQWLHAIEEKGEDARLHASPTVQSVIAAMGAHGLDPFRYGFVCFDEWDEQPEVKDEETGEVAQEHRPAGDRYSLRPSELAHFVMRGLAHRQDELEQRLAALESE